MSAVAIYTRISSADREEQTATARQEAACRALAGLRGWEVAEVFEDVDVSAYAKTTRPSYERLLAAVDAGAVDGIVVWTLDRLVRRVAEFERLWGRCEAKQVMLASVTEPIDTSSALGLAIVRVLVTFAALESATMGTRIRAQAKAMAEQGAAPGTPAYGYTKGYTEIVPEEAKVIREAARRVLAGETSHRSSSTSTAGASPPPAGSAGGRPPSTSCCPPPASAASGCGTARWWPASAGPRSSRSPRPSACAWCWPTATGPGPANRAATCCRVCAGARSAAAASPPPAPTKAPWSTAATRRPTAAPR
ncbi:MAG: recombinase family protein [Actinomycetota bacterium]|nr:recombinase family protein [Actinomycetota bacterium]